MDTPHRLSTPTPGQKPTHKWSFYHTGFTSDKKWSKRFLFVSPNTEEKIDGIHHYQMDLQQELYFEQKVAARRLSFLEQVAIKFRN